MRPTGPRIWQSRPAVRGLAAAAVAAVLALTAAPVAQATSESPISTRLPQRESGSEFWTLSARFDSGHYLFVELGITNLGVGDHNAGAVGHLITPDGRTHYFRKAKKEGKWELSEDGTRIELGPLLLDRSQRVQRFQLDRDELMIDLGFVSSGTDESPDSLRGPEHGFDLIEAAATAQGSVWLRGEPAPTALRGTVALTRRWVESLESKVVLRRIEFFSLEEDASLYFVETLDPDGDARRWMVAWSDGERLQGSDMVETSLDFAGEGKGFERPERLRFSGGRVSGHVDLGAPLVRYNPLQDLPAPLRLLVSPWMRWRTSWSSSPFELVVEREGLLPLRFSGTGLSNVTFFNAVGPVSPADTAPGG